jgi:hypothetical protein
MVNKDFRQEQETGRDRVDRTGHRAKVLRTGRRTQNLSYAGMGLTRQDRDKKYIQENI